MSNAASVMSCPMVTTRASGGSFAMNSNAPPVEPAVATLPDESRAVTWMSPSPDQDGGTTSRRANAVSDPPMCSVSPMPNGSSDHVTPATAWLSQMLAPSVMVSPVRYSPPDDPVSQMPGGVRSTM